MCKPKFVKIIILLFGFIGAALLPSAYAQRAEPSLNWQRLEFQQQIKNELSQSLKSMVGADHFVISVDVKLKKAPVKAKPPEAPKAVSTSVGDPDTLLLSKLGVMVPAQMPEAPTSTSLVEEEPVDMFTLIEKIRVSCLLDTSVPEDRQEVIKKVIASHFLQFDPKLVDISVEKVSLIPPVVEEKQETAVVEKSFAEKFEPFKIPVSIFLSFLTVMAMMLVLFKSSKGGQAAAGASAPVADSKSLEEPAAPKEAAPAPQAEAAVAAHGTGSTVHHGSAAAAGFDAEDLKLTVEKFRILLKTSERSARLLMLEWVNSDSSVAVGALKTLPTYLSLEEFTQMTSDFDANQRKKLKKIMSINAADLPPMAEIMDFVRSQLLSSVLTDSAELTEGHKSYLSSLKASELATLAQEDEKLVGGVINLIPSDLVAQTFNLLEGELVGRVLQHSLQFKVSEFLSGFDVLESKVNAIREESKVVLAPVLDGVETLLDQVGPDKEGALFGALIMSRAYGMVEDLSKRYFPSDLVLKLDQPKINSILLRMPLTQRAELIYSLSESERGVIYQAMGEKGKLRELIDSEIESIAADESRKKTIEMTRVQIWRQFVGLVREAVQSNPMVQENAQTVLRAWIEEKKGEVSPESVELKKVA